MPLPTDLPNPLECQLSAKTTQKLSEGIWLSFSLISKFEKPVKLLTWLTPLEGFLGDLFIIHDEKQQLLAYQGPMIKRGNPTDIDFMSLKPEQHLTNAVELSLVYEFKQNVIYQIKLKDLLLRIKDTEQKDLFVRCTNHDEVTISVI